MSKLKHELWYTKEGNRIDITPIVGNIARRSNKDELGQELTFEVAANDARFFPSNPVDLGGLIQLINTDTGEEVFQGFVFTESRQGTSPITYTVFDLCFYLNKSEEVIQFNNMQANMAITKLLSYLNIQFVPLPKMPMIVDKIYNDSGSNIIKDIIKKYENETGKRMNMRARRGQFIVEEENGNNRINPSFRFAENIWSYPLNEVLIEPSRKRSIEDLRNVVVIESGEKRIHTERNMDSMMEYGTMQHVENIEEEDISKAKNIARNKLKELAKVSEETGITLMGHDDVEAGRIISIEEPFTGLSGEYRILSANHTYSNGNHVVDVEMEAV